MSDENIIRQVNEIREEVEKSKEKPHKKSEEKPNVPIPAAESPTVLKILQILKKYPETESEVFDLLKVKVKRISTQRSKKVKSVVEAEMTNGG